MNLKEYKVAFSASCEFPGLQGQEWDNEFLRRLKVHGLELKPQGFTDDLGRYIYAPRSFSNPPSWPEHTPVGVIEQPMTSKLETKDNIMSNTITTTQTTAGEIKAGFDNYMEVFALDPSEDFINVNYEFFAAGFYEVVGEDFNEEEEAEVEAICEELFEDYLEDCMSTLTRDIMETPLKALWFRFYSSGFQSARIEQSEGEA